MRKQRVVVKREYTHKYTETSNIADLIAFI